MIIQCKTINPLPLFHGGKVDVFKCPLLLHYTCEEEDRSGDKMVCETMLDPVADLPRPERRDRMRGKLASSNYFNHPSYQTHDLLLICVNKLLLFSDKLIEANRTWNIIQVHFGHRTFWWFQCSAIIIISLVILFRLATKPTFFWRTLEVIKLSSWTFWVSLFLKWTLF